MVYFYPIQFEIISRPDFQLEDYRRTARGRFVARRIWSPALRRNEWSTSEFWFLGKLLEDKFKFIEPSTMTDEIAPLIIKKYEDIKKIDEEMFSLIESKIGVDIGAPSLYLDANTMGFYGQDSGLLILFSNSLKSIEPIVETIKLSSTNISSITKDLGISVNKIYTGKDYAIQILRSKAEIIEIANHKNEFEKEVHNKILNNITDSILCNFTLNFKASAETYEYDIVLCFGKNIIYQIECKDYSTVSEDAKSDNTSLRNKVIFQPKDKASLINAKCYVVLKGFSQKLLTEFEAFGKARDVTILDESRYLDVIKKDIMTKLLENII